MQLFLFPRSWPTRKPRNWIGNPAWVVAYDIFDVVLVVGIETTIWIRLLVAMKDEGPQIFIYSLHTPSIGKTWTIHRQWTIIAIFIGYLLSSCLGGQLRLCCGRRHVMTPSPRRAAQNKDDGQIVTIVASISRDIVLLGRHIIAPWQVGRNSQSNVMNYSINRSKSTGRVVNIQMADVDVKRWNQLSSFCWLHLSTFTH